MTYDPTNNDESLDATAEGQEPLAPEPAPEAPATATVDAGAPPPPPPSPAAAPSDPLFDPLFDGAATEPGAARAAGSGPAAPSRKTLVGAGIGAAVIALGAVVGINLASSGAENASTDAAAAGGMTAPGATQDGAAAMPGQGGTPMAGGPGGGTAGTVESIDGSTVTIAGQDGSTVEVATTDDTVVAVSETGSADDIDEGDQVLVMGTADGDAIAAERVIDQGDTASAPTSDNDAQGGPPGGMGGSASGEVSGVDGDSFTVSTADGEVTVTMTDATTIVVETSGSVDDLDEGDTVMVRGETADDGSVTATRIIAGDLPQGGPGGAAMGGQSGMPSGPPMQGGSTDGGTGTTGQMPAAPGGATGSAGQPAGVPDDGGAATTT